MFGPSRFKSMKTVATEYPQADCTFWLMHFEFLSGSSLRAFPSTIMRLCAREPVQVGIPRPKSVRSCGLADSDPVQSLLCFCVHGATTGSAALGEEPWRVYWDARCLRRSFSRRSPLSLRFMPPGHVVDRIRSRRHGWTRLHGRSEIRRLRQDVRRTLTIWWTCIALEALFFSRTTYSQELNDVAHKFLQRHGVPCLFGLKVGSPGDMGEVATCQHERIGLVLA